MTWEERQRGGISHSASELESLRFGMPIGRVTVREDASFREEERSFLRRTILDSPHDVLIVRYPGREPGWGGALATLEGYAVIPAGSLVYWEAPAHAIKGAALESGVAPIVVSAGSLPPSARSEARGAIAAVVRNSFFGYQSHYAANPLFDHEAALDGYVEWALGALSSDENNVLLLIDRATPVGVATLRESDDGGSLEILLAGLVSEVQGRGWYSELLAAVGREAQDRGCARVTISSQSHNTRVQRAWLRAGLEPFAAVETVHVVKQSRLTRT